MRFRHGPTKEPPPDESQPARSASILGAGAAYTLVGAAQRLAGLLLLPLFTKWLSPSEFGQIGLLISISAFAIFVFPLGFEAVVIRGWFHFGSTPDERQTYASEIEDVLLTAPLLLVPALTAILMLVGLTQTVPAPYVALALASASIFTAASLVPYAALRAERRARTYLIVGSGYVGIQLIAKLVLIGGLHKGVLGWVISDLLAALALLSIAPRAAGIELRLRRWTRRARSELSRSLPLVPHGFGQWGLASSDRIILAHFVSLAAVGVYSIAYQACSVLIMIFSELNRAVAPEYASADLDDEEVHAGLRRVVAFQVGVVFTVSLATAFIVPQAIYLFLPSSYAEAGPIVPWLVLGAAFVGIYQIPMNHITFVRGDTQRIWFAAVISTCFSIGLNIALVPHFGIDAAAIVTAATYLLLLVLVRAYETVSTGQPLWPDWSLMVRYVIIVVLLAVMFALIFSLPSTPMKFAVSSLGALAAGTAVLFVYSNSSHHQARPAP